MHSCSAELFYLQGFCLVSPTNSVQEWLSVGTCHLCLKEPTQRSSSSAGTMPPNLWARGETPCAVLQVRMYHNAGWMQGWQTLPCDFWTACEAVPCFRPTNHTLGSHQGYSPGKQETMYWFMWRPGDLQAKHSSRLCVSITWEAADVYSLKPS